METIYYAIYATSVLCNSALMFCTARTLGMPVWLMLLPGALIVAAMVAIIGVWLEWHFVFGILGAGSLITGAIQWRKLARMDTLACEGEASAKNILRVLNR